MTSMKARLGEWSTGSGSGPLYLRLATALRVAIERAEIASGERLPPERVLAEDLEVSRTTVVSAYAALRDDGWVESRQGSGTYASRRGLASAPSKQEREVVGAFRRNTVFRGMLENACATFQFLGAHLDAAPEVEEATRAALAGETGPLCASHGYLPLGLPVLRRALAQYLTDSGLPSSEDQILVTNGTQQAIGLTAALFVERGEPIAVEDPTYLGAIDSYTAAGARLIGVPVGAEGVDVALLRDAVARGARMVYLVPSFQNPTGTVLSEPARRAIARLAEQTQVPIVEDHALADLSARVETPRPIAAFAPGAPILTVGSLSKLFWGGLRVGFARGPAALIDRLARFKAMADLGCPVLNQAVGALVLAKVDDVRCSRRSEIARKRDGLTALLRQHLPSWSWRQPEGGLLLWARLPRGDANDLAPVALRHGVAIVPGSVNSPDRGFADHVRLPFVEEPEAMKRGVELLAEAWREYDATTRERRGPLGVIV
jgi:DNA-binding transcriptional MocR family regulator